MKMIEIKASTVQKTGGLMMLPLWTTLQMRESQSVIQALTLRTKASSKGHSWKIVGKIEIDRILLLKIKVNGCQIL